MPSPSLPLQELLDRREEFKGFLAKRLSDPGAAEDLLQDSLVRALRRAGELRNEDRLVPWFYQLLRHALIDHVRSRSAGRRREERWMLESSGDAEAERQACRCFESLLVTLPATQASLLHLVELEELPLAEAAARLGITANHAGVTLHRARRALRRKLEAFCGDCSAAACLDCDCTPSSPEAPPEKSGRGV